MRLKGSPVDSTSVSFVGAPSGSILGSTQGSVGSVSVSEAQPPSVVSVGGPQGVLEGSFQDTVGRILSIIAPASGGGGSAASRPRLFHVDDYGADPTGETFSDEAVAAARAALGSDPGLIVFGVGTYKLNVGLNVLSGMSLGLRQGVVGQGAGLTKIDFRGQGAAIECRNLAWEFNTASEPSGGVHGLYLYGWANNNNGIYGIRYGDINRMRTSDIHIAGFNNPSSVGFYGDNQVAWSERADIDASVEQCTTAFLFESNASPTGPAAGHSSSFDYSRYKLSFVVVANQDAFILRTSAGCLRTSMNGVDLALTGNCVNAPVGGTNTGVLFTVGRDNNDDCSFGGELHINVETSGTEGGVTHKDFVQGPGPWWLIKSRVRATGSINLIPFSGTNFRQGTSTSFSFSFAGLLRKSPSLGSAPSYQALQTVPQAVGRYGTDPSNSAQMVYVKAATAGTFKLGYGGSWTTDLPYNVSVSAMQTALRAIPALGNNVSVVSAQSRFISGYYADEVAYGIRFHDALAETPVSTLTADTTALTGTGVDVVVYNTGSANKTLNVDIESGSLIKILAPAGTYRLGLNIGTLTDQVGVARDSLFGINAVDVWIQQPSSGGNVVLEGPWFAPSVYAASTYSFQWLDGFEPVLSTEPDAWDVIRLSTMNFNSWIGQHITRKQVVDVPATPTSPGLKGQVAYDADYEYRCIATNTWRRSAISTW